jgi:hypothetical protein
MTDSSGQSTPSFLLNDQEDRCSPIRTAELQLITGEAATDGEGETREGQLEQEDLDWDAVCKRWER